MKLVSIIMPNYNTPMDLLVRAIDSVLCQTYTDWELLVSDDGSDNNNIEIIKQYCENDSRIKLFKNELGTGPASARNTSIKNAKGRLISFLDSDDQWLPFHLSERIKHMTDNNYAFTYSWYQVIDEDGKWLRDHTPRKAKVSHRYLLTNTIIGCLTAIYDREKIGNLYMPAIQKRQDFAFWLKILKRTDYAYLYPKITAIYTNRKQSVSTKKFNLIKYNWAIYRHIEKFNTLKSLYYFSIFLLSYFKRKLFK